MPAKVHDPITARWARAVNLPTRHPSLSLDGQGLDLLMLALSKEAAKRPPLDVEFTPRLRKSSLIFDGGKRVAPSMLRFLEPKSEAADFVPTE